jgi:hypothetical protein
MARVIPDDERELTRVFVVLVMIVGRSRRADAVAERSVSSGRNLFECLPNPKRDPLLEDRYVTLRSSREPRSIFQPRTSNALTRASMIRRARGRCAFDTSTSSRGVRPSLQFPGSTFPSRTSRVAFTSGCEERRSSRTIIAFAGSDSKAICSATGPGSLGLATTGAGENVFSRGVTASLGGNAGSGMRPTFLPAAFLAQYPRPGSGILRRLQSLASATSEISKLLATVRTGSVQILSYSLHELT